jgi:hypothetical protein
MTVTDLMIVKRLCDHGYTAIKDNKIRIGSINYYRDIEDEHRRDGLEGAPAQFLRQCIWVTNQNHKKGSQDTLQGKGRNAL